MKYDHAAIDPTQTELVRFILLISDQEYFLARAPAGWSLKTARNEYIVTDTGECDCPAWTYSQGPKTCKHSRAIAKIERSFRHAL